MQIGLSTCEKTRPDASTLPAKGPISKEKFDISPAVSAIEKMPFLSALAAARKTDLSENIIMNKQQIPHFENAWAALTGWVLAMSKDLTPEQMGLIRKTGNKGSGLLEEIRQSLQTGEDNVRILSKLIKDYREGVNHDPNTRWEEGGRRKAITSLENKFFANCNELEEQIRQMKSQFDSSMPVTG